MAVALPVNPGHHNQDTEQAQSRPEDRTGNVRRILAAEGTLKPARTLYHRVVKDFGNRRVGAGLD